MAKTLEDVRNAVIANFQKAFPGEKVSKSPFSVYLLDVHSKLLYKILCKAKVKVGSKDATRK